MRTMITRWQLDRRLPAARAAVATGFLLSGVAFASWVVRIPDMQQRLALSESRLGLVLLGVAVGGLLAMPLSSVLIGRFGSRAVARGGTLTLAAAIALPPHLPTALALALLLVVLGSATSILSVALNTQAASLERRTRRPLMAGLHALYSLGGLLGAAAGGAVAGMGASAQAHLLGAGLAIAAVCLATSGALLPHGLDGVTRAATPFVRPSRTLVLMGLVAFCCLFGEGAVADWSAVYLRDAMGAGPGLAAAGYAAFSLMMAAGRFVGDALTVRLGAAWLVRGGAVAATLGIALAVGQGNGIVAVAGFGLVGAGLATIFPTVLAVAGRTPGAAPASAIAAVSTIGYLGFLAGPPLIGFVAEATGLRAGVGVIGGLSVLIVFLAGVVPGKAAAVPRRAPAGAVLARTPMQGGLS